jgi:tRNA nucleotidyltransferase (CCA-adding enzyme)
VQVVARSSTDSVDVGNIAGELGGGGHDRAAAAPVRGLSVAQVRERVIGLCHSHSRPAVTVRQLMSLGRPQTLNARTPINKAAKLMRRYGHEGYPVVESHPDGGETLLGMITRQEADRTVGHGLGAAPVIKYMREGNYTVTPDDSVATLRQLMLTSGWGQIPVVNSTGELIGIVTRTDLIKLWDRREGQTAGRSSIGHRLQDALPPISLHLLRVASKEAAKLGFNAYVVGGFVRDLLLHDTAWRVPALDMDIVIEGDAIQLGEQLQSRFGGRLVTHRRFGTAKWLLDNGDHPVNREKLLGDLAGDPAEDLPDFIDLVSARTEFYTAPTALPTVERSSIKLDLHRRDFTINTLAVNLHPDQWGEMLDFYNGMADLEQGRIRVLHSLSFVDDPTRILRAVRYEQRFSFHIGPRTLQLLHDAVELLDKVSPARVRHELDRILQEATPEKTLARLDELGVLAQLHPDLGLTPWVADGFRSLRAAMADLDQTTAFAPDSLGAIRAIPMERYYWGVLVYPIPQTPLVHANQPALQDGEADPDQALAERLGLRRETAGLVADLRKLQAQRDLLHRPDLLPSQVVAALGRIGPAARFLFRMLEPEPRVRHYLDSFEQTWRHVDPELDGQDLQRLGIRRGPIFRTILTALRDARLDGRIHSRAQEEALAVEMARGGDAAIAYGQV